MYRNEYQFYLGIDLDLLVSFLCTTGPLSRLNKLTEGSNSVTFNFVYDMFFNDSNIIQATTSFTLFFFGQNSLSTF